MFSGIDPCALGSIVEVLINSNGAGSGMIEVFAESPTGRPLECPVKEDDGVYTATFQPDEAGEWSIAVTYDDENIQGSPFTCHVFDPNAIKVHDLNDGTERSPGRPFTFVVDASGCGWGDAKIDVTREGRSVPSRTLEVERSIYEVTFTPMEAAKYKIYVYFNGHEVRGSPFPLYLGVEKPPERKKSKKKKSSKEKDSKERKTIIKEYSSVIDSPGYNDRTNNNNSNDNYNSLTKTYDSSIGKSILNNIHDSSTNLQNSSSSTTANKSYFSSLKRDSTTTNSLNRNSESIFNRNPHLKADHTSSLDRPSSLSKMNSSHTDKLFSSSSLNRSVNKSSTKVGLTSPTVRLSSPTRSPLVDLVPTRTERLISSQNRNSSLFDRSDDSRYNSNYKSTMDSSYNSSNTTVINTGLNSSSLLNRSSSSPIRDKYSTKIHDTSFNSINSHSNSLNSPRSPPISPYESPRHSPLRQTASFGENAPNLSSPLKVLQASQNAVQTDGDSFYYNSVVNMKILPSTY